MYRTIFTVSFFLLFTFNIHAQDDAKKSETKIIRAEDNKIYINKKQGVYIWLSTSPDPGSEKFRLKSDSTSRYTNPMYFDTEGYNTFRSPSAVDTSSKNVIYPLRDIIFEVYADGIAPVCNAVYHYTFIKKIAEKTFYDKGLKIEIKCTDAVSGVSSLLYSLNDDNFRNYTEPLTSFREGENILKYYAADRVGNTGNVQEVKFYIDKTPPVTHYEIEGKQNEKYISAGAVIKLSASDDLSGIEGIYYKINEGKYSRYTVPVPASLLLKQGSTISFYSEDRLGNKEKVQTIGGSESIGTGDGNAVAEGVVFEFYVDNKAPEVKLDVNPDVYTSKYNYISSRSLFTIKAEDDKSGVDKIYYSINKSSIENDYKSPFTIEKKGLQYIRVKAVDYVGNNSSPITKIFYCDTDAPKSNLVVGKPKFRSHDTLFVTGNTLFTITGSDAESGLGSINYSINGSPDIKYTGGFKLEKEGFASIVHSAQDNVANSEEAKNTKVFVDNTAPVIHYHFSVEAIGSKIVREENTDIYPPHVMIYIAATDKSSGGERIEYSVNGGAVQTVNPVKSFVPGSYIINVYAYDVLGNISKEKIRFSVEK